MAHARQKRTDLVTLLLLFGMYVLLIGNVALYFYSPVHVLVHLTIGAIAINMAFTIWHEAVHGTVSRRPWVNDVVGIAGMLPYMTPYFMQRWVHLEHHRRLNHEDDPNFIYTDGPLLTLPLRYPRALRYAKRLLKKDPRTGLQRASDVASLVFVAGIYLIALSQGALFDVLVLWFVPAVLAKFAMDFYVNYLPHVGLPADRYLGTRIIDIPWFTPLVFAHNYHAVHHLWPTIPWHRYRATYRKKRAFLERHGVPIERTVFPRIGKLERIPASE